MDVNINPKDKEELDNFKSMSVGQIFVKARMSQNIEISQVAAHLNIGTPHLEAIEADDRNALPPKVYAIGFVRAYADALGLDSEKMAYLFKKQFYGLPQQQRNNSTASKNRSMADYLVEEFGDYILGGVIIAVLVIIVVVVGWVLWPNGEDVQSTIPEISEQIELQSSEEMTGSAPHKDIVQKAVEPIDMIVKPDNGGKAYGGEPLTSPLVFKANEKSWIEIVAVTGKEMILSRTLNAGDVFYTPADKDVLVTTGNAGGIDVYLDGQNLGALGKKAEILRLRPFSVDALRLQIQK